jgi:AAHS family 4-hydroxybenzoate transporter-like MFS transporter
MSKNNIPSTQVSVQVDALQNKSNSPSMSPFQVFMIVVCFILNFCDGIDVLAVSFSSTEIIKEWSLSKTEMGYVFSSGLAGMTLGCFLIAPFADHVGRRKILLVSLTLISIGMLLVSICSSYQQLLWLRFLTGLGIGGILPVLAATASEFSSPKFRDFNVGLVQAGWPVGAILTGFVCAYTIPLYGWRTIFLLAGIVSFLLLVLVYFFMVDSLDYLLRKQPDKALNKINALLLKMNRETVKVLPGNPEVKVKAGPSSLFNNEYRDSTIKSWGALFFSFITLYTLMSWVPTIAADSGLPLDIAIYVGISLNAGAALGSSLIGAIGSKFGLRQTVFVFMICAFAVMLLYGNFSWPTVILFVLIFFIGVFVQGGFNGLFPTLSRIYHTDIRATGIGYGFGIGRLGAIIGPALFGLLADKGLTTAQLFSLFSIPVLISGLCVLVIKSSNLVVTRDNVRPTPFDV